MDDPDNDERDDSNNGERDEQSSPIIPQAAISVKAPSPRSRGLGLLIGNAVAHDDNGPVNLDLRGTAMTEIARWHESVEHVSR